MESPTSTGRKRQSYCLSNGFIDFDDCSFDDDSESYTESESMTIDDDEEEETTFRETLPDRDKPSNSYASLESSATPEEKKNGLVLTLEMVQFLRKSASEGNVAGMIHRESMHLQPPFACQQKANASIDQFKGKNKPLASKNMSTTDLFHLHQSSLVEESVVPSPKATLERILKANGRAINCRKYTEVPSDYYVKCEVNPQSLPLLKAVRENDLARIRHMHEVEGLSLQCSNKFQESLVHTVARHGLSEILLYLKQEAGVSMRVCCDGGRNALHDACWTNTPNFDVIRILIEDSPDLLYIRDKRNFTPLDYIPKEAYKVWNEWLQSNKPLLLSSTM
jgi:hypothetical protein